MGCGGWFGEGKGRHTNMLVGEPRAAFVIFNDIRQVSLLARGLGPTANIWNLTNIFILECRKFVQGESKTTRNRRFSVYNLQINYTLIMLF